MALFTRSAALSIHPSSIRNRKNVHFNQANSEPSVQVLECDISGKMEIMAKSLEDIDRLRTETKLPIRDMRMFFQSQKVVGRSALILPRPSSKCFLVNLEHIKFLCQEKRCIILNPEHLPVKSFVRDLGRHLVRRQANLPGKPKAITTEKSSSNLHSFLDAISYHKETKMELVVMEVTLSTMTKKFQRHLNLLKPLLEMLLMETSSNPSAEMLRRVLAFRKSLNDFEIKIDSTKSAISDVLSHHVDLQGLCITRSEKLDVEEMELLLEAYNMDLKEIEYDLASMKEQIEDTHDFINIHLNTIRNNIIQMSLFMEMGTLAVGLGALSAGLFGMNLSNSLETHPFAFYVVSGGIFLLSGTVFGICVNRYTSLRRDVSDAKCLHALKHFFDYVQEIEDAMHVSEDGNIDRRVFREILKPAIGSQLTHQQVEKIFQQLDFDRDGMVNRSELATRKDSAT